MASDRIALRPTHPSELLREDVNPALRKSKAAIARLLGVSRQTLHDVLNERQPITPRLALRIGKLCGNGPDICLMMQGNYDLAVESAAIADEIDAIPTLGA